ncbi:MAG: SEC-C domain-containing protein [Actinobacteria bacterium]|nr:SEC-C domain-containing protein [Actinomycetota bacterium]
MDEGEARLERLTELLLALKTGQASPKDHLDELKELVGWRFAPVTALVEADILQEKHEAGEISAEEALSIVQRHADAFPAVPILFIYCSYFSHLTGADDDSVGYMALYKLKSDQVRDSDFGRNEEWEAVMRPFLEKLERDDELLELWPYLDEGCEHLVNHFILQELTDGVLYDDDEWREIILARLEALEPLFLNMLDDQLRLHLITGCYAPAGMHRLIALLGCYKDLSALPALLAALDMCTGQPLVEALLAVVKIGSRYPREVSGELREIASDKEREDSRLAAVEALGMLWKEEGNLDFLQGMIAGWGPDVEDGNHLFRFLVHALLSTGEASAVQAVASALESCRDRLDDHTVFFTEDYLEHRHDMRLGPSLDDIVSEGPEDLLAWPPSDLAWERRRTLTAQREEDLEAMEEEVASAYDLEIVEKMLRQGRNDICACGSGLKFKKCCLPRLEEIRDRLAMGEEVKVEKSTFALLVEDLQLYALLPSVQAERPRAVEEFFAPLGRTWLEREPVFGGLSEKDIFEDWFQLARPLDHCGKTVVREMLEANEKAYDPPALALLRGLADSRFSVYEVQEAVPGKELTLRDIFRGEDIRVRERTASRELVKWDLVATRVGWVGDHHEIMGLSFLVPRRYLKPLEDFVARVSRDMPGKKLSDRLDFFLQRRGYLVFCQVAKLFAEEPMPVSITAEGDEVALCTAVFDVEDAEEARRRLSSHPYIEDLGSKRGVRKFAWYLSRELENELRRGEHVGPQNRARTFSISPKGITEEQEEAEKSKGNVMRAFGSLELRGKKLTFEAQSLQRLEAGKKELSQLLAGVATHRVDSIMDQEALLGEAWRKRGEPKSMSRDSASTAAPLPLKDIPEGSIRKAFDEMLEKTYGNWLDEPLSCLGGKTPRQAAKTARGRELVNRLLKDYENMAERQRREGTPAFDFSRFRRELDIWP